MIKREFRKLISDIKDSEDSGLAAFRMGSIVTRYNQSLEKVQELHPNNSFIQTKIPLKFNPLFNDWDEVAREIKLTSNYIIKSLSTPEKQQPQQVNYISIGYLQGQFSFKNIISEINNSNIGNRTEVISYVNEFKKELNKPSPDKNKLKRILGNLGGFRNDVVKDVIKGLLVEFAKRFIHL